MTTETFLTEAEVEALPRGTKIVVLWGVHSLGFAYELTRDGHDRLYAQDGTRGFRRELDFAATHPPKVKLWTPSDQT